MLSYCSTLQTIDSVPPQADMEMFRPYFEVPVGCSCIDVFILVPSNCYFIESDDPNPPAGGACVASGDLQNTIYIGYDAGCSNTTPIVLRTTLNYSYDPSGHDLVIYSVDMNTGATTYSETKKAVK